MTFERFPGRFALEGRLRAVTALHVGAGRALSPVATDRPVVRDALDQPFIPGSSLKGLLRGEVERLVRAVRPARACNPVGRDGERCVPRGPREPVQRTAAAGERTDQVGNGERPAVTRASLDDLCWVCRLFGSPWMASRVQVADLPVRAATWLGQLEVRDGVPVDRDTGTARSALKHDREVVPPGVEFECRLRADTDDPRLLGMLALGLQQLEAGRLALGGARSRGLGRVELLVERRTLVRRDAESLLGYLTAPEAGGVPVDAGTVSEWATAFLDCLRADALPEEPS
jgi:CRISPR-associated RAMP protein (TIGR02581 family)